MDSIIYYLICSENNGTIKTIPVNSKGNLIGLKRTRQKNRNISSFIGSISNKQVEENSPQLPVADSPTDTSNCAPPEANQPFLAEENPFPIMAETEPPAAIQTASISVIPPLPPIILSNQITLTPPNFPQTNNSNMNIYHIHSYLCIPNEPNQPSFITYLIPDI